MKRRIAGSLHQALTFAAHTARRAGLLMGVLAVSCMSLPAAAEPAGERADETLVFVGELVSIESLPNPCDEARKRTKKNWGASSWMRSTAHAIASCSR